MTPQPSAIRTMTNSGPFSRTRLQLARAFNETTQAELADKVGVKQPFIGLLETGRRQPSGMLAAAIAHELGFEPQFFYEDSADEFRSGDWSFRRYQSATAASMNRVLAQGTLFSMLVSYLDTILKLPSDTLPTIHRPANRDEIERAAEHCRMQLGLGLDVPVKNVIRAFERAGVVVASVRGTSGKIDAVSRSAGRRPVVLVSDDKGSASRRRYDVGHEGGHLVMHIGLETGTQDTEEEANIFASAFLLPRRGFIREFPRAPSGFWSRTYWRELFEVKKRWRVSAAAIIRRAFDLRMIDAGQYRRAYKFMSGQGWLRNGEPPATEPEMEEPEMLPRAFSILSARRGTTQRDIAAALGWTPEVLERVSGIPTPPAAPSDEPKGRLIPLPVVRSTERP
jgi:Zn-dependent peptidase ImmA (M78 family)/transcriptional regulator with XRE-family HTH domain